MSAFIRRILKKTNRFSVAWEASRQTGVVEVTKLRAAQSAGKLDKSEKSTQEYA